MPFDEDPYRTIAVGISIGGMPRNQNLEVRDRWALVAYVKTLAVLVKSEGTRDAHFLSKAPGQLWSVCPAPEAPNPVRGRTLITAAVGCAACPGPGGKGDGPTAQIFDASREARSRSGARARRPGG